MSGKADRIIDLITTILGEDVTIDTSMANTPRWDSLRTLQIVMALDENGISIPFERIAEIRSVRDIVSISCGGSEHE